MYTRRHRLLIWLPWNAFVKSDHRAIARLSIRLMVSAQCFYRLQCFLTHFTIDILRTICTIRSVNKQTCLIHIQLLTVCIQLTDSRKTSILTIFYIPKEQHIDLFCRLSCPQRHTSTSIVKIERSSFKPALPSEVLRSIATTSNPSMCKNA